MSERPSIDPYATRPSIFLRLRSDDSAQRELSWQQFHDRYAPVIRAYAATRGVRGEEADDVVQDVIVGFFQASPRFAYDPSRGRFRGYLKKATVASLSRLWKRKARSTQIPDDAEPAGADDEKAWERAWEASVLERALADAKSRVAERTWEAFELTEIRGVPVPEAAQRLGLGIASVHQARSRLSRAVRETVEKIRLDEG